MTLELAETDAQIAATYEVMRQLRPHITPDDYLPLVRGMMASEGFRLAALRDEGEVRGVAGYRYMHTLSRGRVLYVDDLVTDARARSRGYGKALLDWLKAEARREACSELQLISRTVREDAHRFYFREGLGIECFHFRIQL